MVIYDLVNGSEMIIGDKNVSPHLIEWKRIKKSMPLTIWSDPKVKSCVKSVRNPCGILTSSKYLIFFLEYRLFE
jgi:hypothetical protein